MSFTVATGIYAVDMTVGHLLLWSVTSALVAPLAFSVVYEAKLIDADFFRGFSRNGIYLRLSTR